MRFDESRFEPAFIIRKPLLSSPTFTDSGNTACSPIVVVPSWAFRFFVYYPIPQILGLLMTVVAALDRPAFSMDYFGGYCQKSPFNVSGFIQIEHHETWIMLQ
jgi:hypothetical protein